MTSPARPTEARSRSSPCSRAACAAQDLPVWDDPWNDDPAYTRVRLRTEVLPLLEEVLQGGVAEALARTATALRADTDALDASMTDWSQVVALYDQLVRLDTSPIIALNRSIAVAELNGPEVALATVDRLEGKLAGYHAFHATRADLLRRLGRTQQARAAYDKAIDSKFADMKNTGGRHGGAATAASRPSATALTTSFPPFAQSPPAHTPAAPVAPPRRSSTATPPGPTGGCWSRSSPGCPCRSPPWCAPARPPA